MLKGIVKPMLIEYKKINKYFLIFIYAVFSMLLLEGSIRLIGLINFPLVIADNKIGYIYKPNQHGSFLNRNDWRFNSHSMQNDEEFLPSNSLDVLLIGDSIVAGGNSFKKEDRLGSKLARDLNTQVWSISAGSWSLLNELIYLENHPEVIQGIDKFIFILNSGDFTRPSSWSCEYTHPRSYPYLSLIHI